MKGRNEQARALRRAEAEDAQGPRDPATDAEVDLRGVSENRQAGRQEATLVGAIRSLARLITSLLGRYLVTRRHDVGSVAISHVTSAVRTANESISSAACPTGPDIPGHVVAQVIQADAQKVSKPVLDLGGSFGFDHAQIEPEGSDTTELHVRLDGQDVALLIPAEELGILLRPADALALGRSLIAASEEALG
jgi:hypothetical protein